MGILFVKDSLECNPTIFKRDWGPVNRHNSNGHILGLKRGLANLELNHSGHENKLARILHKRTLFSCRLVPAREANIVRDWFKEIPPITDSESP